MKLFSLKKKSAISQKATSSAKASWSVWKRTLLRPEVVLWFLSACVFGAELYAVYASVYKNLATAETTPEARKSATAARINLDQYQRAIKRLDSIEQFKLSPAIDFSGTLSTIGRSNPFADPE